MSEKKFVILIGKVGVDPTVKDTRSGPVVSFPLYVSTGFTPDDKDRKWDVSIWNEGLRDTAKSEYYKGSYVGVIGLGSAAVVDGRTYYQVTATFTFLCAPGVRTKDNRSAAPKPAAAPLDDLGF